MKRVALFLFLVGAPAALAQTLSVTPRGIAVAHHSRLELFDRTGGTRLWSVGGVEHPSSMASDDTRVAVLDALANEGVVTDLATGKATRFRTGETPVAALFVRGSLFVLARDARVLQHVGVADIPLPADAAFTAESEGKIYVYARTPGSIEEISDDRVVRRIPAAPSASDFEVAGGTGYLVYPREGRIRMIDLRSMQPAGEITVGSVPVDLAFAGGGTAITARILAVADPSAKRVWLTETTQSMSKAVTRGFLRGVLGLGLFSNRAAEFPTGVDRVLVRGAVRIAYDSSSRTLYRSGRHGSTVVARDVGQGAFAIADDKIVWWDGTAVQRR